MNQENVDRLKQGAEQWNAWYSQLGGGCDLSGSGLDLFGPDRFDVNLLQVDLSDATLSGADLRGVNLHNVSLRDATLSDANLSGATLTNADLSGANLNGANLNNVHLSGATLSNADLSGATLRSATLRNAHLLFATLNNADLGSADLSNANLSGANLNKADLSNAHLSGAHLSGANLSGASVFQTIFANVDLRITEGLVEINHAGPSIVQLHTVQLPQDGSALHFLRGAGVPDEWIDFWRSTMMHPIQYHSCFISYSNKDDALARRLHADLQDRGVRCWFAPEDMKIGDKIRPRIDEMIHQQDKLLLLLSEHALASAWVEDEVEAAIEKEQRQQREVLFPVRLDNEVMETNRAWAAKLRRQRHIGDFTNWTDSQAYQIAFDRLLRDLKKADE